MFGDFGNSSQRSRMPRGHSPFGSINRPHPMFPARGADVHWDEDPFNSSNLPKSHTPENINGHVERIIPIQIIGSTTTVQQQQPKYESDISSLVAPPTTSTLSETLPPGSSSNVGTVDKKYSSQRHNTTDNLQVKNQNDKQRSKSEPPVQWISDGTGTLGSCGIANSTSPVSSSQAPQSNKPTTVITPPMAELGGKQTKNKSQENSGFRNIPIFVEGRGPVGGVGNSGDHNINKTHVPPQQSQQQQQPPPTSTPQKNRFQPDQSELSTTPPPPAKKVTKDTMQIIREIVEDVQNLEKEVNALSQTTKTAKNYIFLDEMLTRNLIKLDIIETEGREDIRLSRRDCIKLITKVISILEGKTQEPCMELVLVSPTSSVINSTLTSQPQSNNSQNNETGKEDVTPIDLALTPSTPITTNTTIKTEIEMEINSASDTTPVSGYQETTPNLTSLPN